MSARETSGSAPQHSHPHNNTMSRNEKFWVDQVTVPHPPPPGERQGVGNDKGGGGYMGLRIEEAATQGLHGMGSIAAALPFSQSMQFPISVTQVRLFSSV